MASPQRPDPDEPRRDYRDYEDLKRARMERRTSTGAGFAWWWAFWIIIIGLAVWWAGWGWGGSGGWWWGNRTGAPAYGTPYGNGRTTPPAANQAAINGPGLDILNATDKNPYIGKPFEANDVPVQRQVNDHVLWVGANNATPMLLVLTGNGNTAANAHIGQGSLIDITGTVQKPPPQQQAQQQWSLNDDGAKRLEQQGAYIQANQVHTVQP